MCTCRATLFRDAYESTSDDTAATMNTQENNDQERAQEQIDENPEILNAEFHMEQSALQQTDIFMHTMPTPLMDKKRQLTLHGTILSSVQESKPKKKGSSNAGREVENRFQGRCLETHYVGIA